MAADAPNPFRDRAPWLNIDFGGVRALAALTKIDGVKTSDEWKKQKSKETSGNTNVFAGTTKGEPKLTFLATTAEEYDWIVAHWKQLEPVPGLGGSGTGAAAAPTGGNRFSGGVVTPKTSAVGSPPAASSTADAADAKSTAKSSTPDPGPRPPTISVQYEWLRFHGILAVARKEWEGPTFTDTLGVEVTITYIAQDPPKPAGAGAMAPAAPGSQFSGGVVTPKDGAGAPVTPAGTMNKNAAAGAAGT